MGTAGMLGSTRRGPICWFINPYQLVTSSLCSPWTQTNSARPSDVRQLRYPKQGLYQFHDYYPLPAPNFRRAFLLQHSLQQRCLGVPIRSRLRKTRCWWQGEWWLNPISFQLGEAPHIWNLSNISIASIPNVPGEEALMISPIIVFCSRLLLVSAWSMWAPKIYSKLGYNML